MKGNSPLWKDARQSIRRASGLMAPTNVYNLRSGSHTPSKNDSPVKSGRKSTSTTGSPIKKQRKNSTNFTQRITTIPDAIVQALEAAKVESVEDMAKLTFEDLVGRVLGKVENGQKEKDPVGTLLKKEIMTAWLRCLHSLSQHPEMNASHLIWQDWLECRLRAKRQHSPSLPRTLEGMRIPLTRGELVKQRQSLKKSGGPKPSRQVTRSMLKDAKERLTELPMGKALKGKVQPGQLQETRSKLKHCDSNV